MRISNVATFSRPRVRRHVSQMPSPRFLNLGAGPRGRGDADWLNVDACRDDGIRFRMDFSRKLPFRDSSFDGVFSEHVLEHFDLGGGAALLREIYRILKPGGCVRIVVPDAQFLLRQYVDCPSNLISWRRNTDITAMSVINDYFHQRYEHQFLYDFETLRYQLVQIGFDRVNRAAFGEGNVSRSIVLDDPKYEWESLYVEARRPA